MNPFKRRQTNTSAPIPVSPKGVSEPKGISDAHTLLKRLFHGVDGQLAMRLWNGTTLQLGNSQHDEDIPPRFALVFHHPKVIPAMALGRDPLRLAEAYFRNDIDIEGDFFSALSLKDHLHSIKLSACDRGRTLFAALRLLVSRNSDQHHLASSGHSPLHGKNIRFHSKQENRDAIAFHYDVSNAFYALWLDQAMVYSCAYFEHPDDDLDQAQQAKLNHICRKLLLKPGERLLDIGCGWGALLIHAAQHFGVYACGITLSRQQQKLARERIARAGLENRVTVELCDYRDLQGESVYDKIASVGMFEHVGLKNLPRYFATVHRLLKPAGLFLNHGITHDQEGWRKTLSTAFINRYVFPDGQLDTISNIQRGMEQAGFEIQDVEALRRHYALTLRHWVSRLEQQHTNGLRYVSEATYRVWRLYMAASALEFESGAIGVYQVLVSKRPASDNRLPLTRRHLYVKGCPEATSDAIPEATTEETSEASMPVRSGRPASV